MGRGQGNGLEVDTELEKAKEEGVVRKYYETRKLAKSYQAEYPGISNAVAAKKAREILEKPESIEYMRELIERNAKKGYASLDAAKSFLTRVMEGKEKDQFGLDASLRDRTEAADKIIRYYGGYKDKQDVNVNVNFADALKEARQRAALAIAERTIDAEVVDDGGKA